MNASPSLTSTTANDRILKHKLIDNIFSIVIPPTGVPECVYTTYTSYGMDLSWNLFFSVRWNKVPSAAAMGNFELLIDEEVLAQEVHANDKYHHRQAHHRWK